MKILICDDHSLFGFGVQGILEKHGYIVTVVHSSEAFITEVKNSFFNIVLIDYKIDHKTGFELFIETKEHLNNTKTFLLTAYDEPFIIKRCKKLGFNGFLRKESSTQEFVEAIQVGLNSQFYNSSIKIAKNENFNNDLSSKKVRLSQQEKEVIKLIVNGGTSKTIAEKLFISKLTADTHRRNIYRKLEITGISSLIRYANENLLAD